MKLEQIFQLWEQDSKIDSNDLSNESINIPKLHCKYLQILSNERLVLKKYEIELKELQLEKYEFFLMGPTREQKDKGWELPAAGKVLKADIPLHMDADRQLTEIKLKIGIQKEKMSVLEDIIKTLHYRNFLIKNYVDWERFKVGG